MKILFPFIGGALVLWYTTEVMPDEILAAVPYGTEYPDLFSILAAVLTFVVLVILTKKLTTHARS